MRVRRAMTMGIAGLGAVVGAASVAWGCASVTSPYLNALQPNRGPVPASVVVTGGNWVAGQNLNLVWAPTGQQLTSVTPSSNGSFSARVEIPASAERGKDYVDYVRAVQGTAYANTPFGVDSPAQEGAPTVHEPERVTSMSTSGGTGKPSSGSTAEPAPQPSSQPQPSGSGGIPTRPADSTADAGSAAPGSAANAETSASPAPGGNRSPAAPAVTGSRVREGSTATANAGTASPFMPAAPARAESSPDTAQAQAARGSLGDLWTGVEGAPATPGHSLLNLPAETEGTPSGLVGVGGVLAISLIALSAGFGVAEVRRRRVLAEVEG